MLNNYVVYHLHDEDSLLDSCTNYKLYIDKAKELNQTAICFTNHGNIYQWAEKKMYCDKIVTCDKCKYASEKEYKQCKDCNKYSTCIDRKNIKYLHGVEIYLTKTHNEKVRDNFHTILIAKNYDGFLELNKLIDMSTQEDHTYYNNRLSFDEFLNISNNIIKISACLKSPLANIPEDDLYFPLLAQKYDYYEIQPHIYSEDQRLFNQKLYELSKVNNKKLIAATDTHSLDKYKTECRHVLQKGKRRSYSNEDEFDLTYKSYDELVKMFEQQNSLPKEIYIEAINETNIMADSVETFELDLSFKYPKLYDNEEEVFKNLIEEKYQYKLQNNIIKYNPQYLINIEEEFRVFKKLNMISFMLFMSELITWCRENKIPVGVGRGSVGGSTIAYITDITDCDPIIWNTVFSRFCNEDRLEIGDIDVDIAPSFRQQVYDYIINKYGIDYTAYVLAIGTISDKGTIDEIGRALDFFTNDKIKELNALELSPEEYEEQYKILHKSLYGLSKISEIKKEFEEDSEETKKKYPEIFYYFDGLVNTAVSQSMHPAGIIISPVTLPDNYGTFWNKGKRIISITMDEIHEVSLVKYDILGLKNVEIINDTCNIVGIPYPLSHEINWEDKNVWEDMIKSPVGVFQFESKYSFDLLSKYMPYKINDMNLVNSSLRPSGASYRDKLIAKEFNKNPSKIIDNLLKENLGYLVFQEDTIKFLTDVCGFSGSEADNVRRAIGRKQRDRVEKTLPQILEGYCSKSDKPREVAEEEAKVFLEIIENSSDYQFGYNHSTQYSMIGYICAMLRYYYPLEFITAFLNNANNEDDIVSGVELAKFKGIKIKPIKFRYSGSGYTCDKKTKSIYQGISSIKFLQKNAAEQLYTLKDKTYDTFIDLLIELSTLSINSRQMEILINLNYFSEFGNNKKLLSAYLYFQKLYGKKTIKKDKLSTLLINENIIKLYTTETDKTFKNLDSISLLKHLYNLIPNESQPLEKQLKLESDFLGYCQTQIPITQYSILCPVEFNTQYTPKIKFYNISTGQEQEYKIYKNIFKQKPFDPFSLIRIKQTKVRPKSKLVGHDPETNKPIFEQLKETENYIMDYVVMSDKEKKQFNNYIISKGWL